MDKGYKRWILIFCFLFFNCISHGDPVSKALKVLKKGKHQQVESILTKSLEKYHINPGARYVWSLLYFDSTYTRRHLDSAHLFIEQALVDEMQPDSLGGWPLEKSSLTRQHLLIQKHRIDSAAYAQAISLNTVESLQYFVDNYSNSVQYRDAITHRNILAFDIAAAENTYQSYQSFMELYPESEQANEARKRYDLLLFQSMTKGGRLPDYLQFLEENPNSPYRSKAEQQIFQLQTLDDRPQSYKGFIKNFPHSPYASRALSILYHRDKEGTIASEVSNDSLKQVYALESIPLVPIFEDGHYGFVDDTGNYRIPARYDSIPENYLCQQLTSDIFLGYVDQKLAILARNEKVLWEQPFERVDELDRGLLKISANQETGLLHKSGWLVLDIEYEQVILLNNGLLAVQKNKLWGINGINGREILPLVHQEIVAEGDFIFLKRDQWAVTTVSGILQLYEERKQPSYLYDDWELLSPQYAVVFKSEEEGLINYQLNFTVPVSNHKIYEIDSANWSVKTAHGTIRFYGESLGSLPPDRYQDYLANDHFICLLRYPKWEVWGRDNLAPVNEFSYDSVARLGTQVLLLMDAKKTSILFGNGSMLELDQRQTVKLIRGADQLTGFLQVSGKGGLRQVYDLNGKEIYRTWFYDLQPLSNELLIIEKNGLKGVINLNGKILLQPRYRTIVVDAPNHLSLLQNGRFGAFDPTTNQLIQPQYQSRVTLFGNDLFLTAKNGKTGLIDGRNKVLVPFEFDEIQPWSDSAVVTRKARDWSIYNYVDKITALDNSSQWRWVNNSDKKTAIIRSPSGYGLVCNEKGVLLNPGFNDIINLGSPQQPIFFTEKYIAEADYYVVIYYNANLEVLRKQVFDSGNYHKIFCY